MTKFRTVAPFALLSLSYIAACQRPIAQAAPAPAQATTAAAPFASPPVLSGAPDVATLVANVKPAVVNITTVHEVKTPRMRFDFPFGFNPFGKMDPDEGGPGEDVMRQSALGSGFIVDSKGHVVTNAHVVDDADKVKVRLADEREVGAKVIGRDPRLDLAVLELVGATNLPFAALGSSDALRVGEYVVAIGNPFGLGHTVTMGIVSAKSRTIGAGPYDDFIQTDASINPGNSGGPLFNLKGEVVGINTAINPNGRGIGFAIPVDALKEVLPQLITTGSVARGRLGVHIQPVTPALAKALGLDRPKGALVADVEPSGPAAKAGLRGGDLILAVNGTEIAHTEELPRTVAKHTPGSQVSLRILRDRTERVVNVTLDALKDGEPRASSDEGSGDRAAGAELGVAVADAPGGGALIQRVMRGGRAAGQLRPGDIVLEVNQGPVANASDLIRKLKAVPKDRPLLLKIRRGDATLFVAIDNSN